MVMVKYVKREARPSYKPSILSQQNIEAVQKLIADAVNSQQINLTNLSFVMQKPDHFYAQGAYNEIDKCTKSQLVAYRGRLVFAMLTEYGKVTCVW